VASSLLLLLQLSIHLPERGYQGWSSWLRLNTLSCQPQVPATCWKPGLVSSQARSSWPRATASLNPCGHILQPAPHSSPLTPALQATPRSQKLNSNGKIEIPAQESSVPIYQRLYLQPGWSLDFPRHCEYPSTPGTRDTTESCWADQNTPHAGPGTRKLLCKGHHHATWCNKDQSTQRAPNQLGKN